MRSFVLLGIYALSTLSAAESKPEPETEYVDLESRQLPQLAAGAALSGLLGLGALASLGTVAGALNSYGKGQQPCKCSLPRCEGAKVRSYKADPVCGKR
jgi:hypothetical protein